MANFPHSLFFAQHVQDGLKEQKRGYSYSTNITNIHKLIFFPDIVVIEKKKLVASNIRVI